VLGNGHSPDDSEPGVAVAADPIGVDLVGLLASGLRGSPGRGRFEVKVIEDRSHGLFRIGDEYSYVTTKGGTPCSANHDSQATCAPPPPSSKTPLEML
jgi:hypothetical protein